MMLQLILWPLMAFILPFNFTNYNPEIDAVWDEVSRVVAKGDYEGYATLFHEDAVLVVGMSDSSMPISKALEGWKAGFENTKSGKMEASVEFRFSKRMHSNTTAHDTGIFKYTSAKSGEEAQSIYIHFEALMVKVEGEWKMTMEYQKAMATAKEYEALQ
ncbi:MAG: SgcJ/EcaC family oxidoreductase [Balneolaceae bacterium]|nr:SgcJ/EcaC family oxidoreductase [Balneolaceae bacterium]